VRIELFFATEHRGCDEEYLEGSDPGLAFSISAVGRVSDPVATAPGTDLHCR
jgi:hypothetical protein